VVVQLGARHALDAERADAQVDAAGAIGVALGRLRELDRLAVAGGEAALVGDRDPLDRGLGRAAGRLECGRGGGARWRRRRGRVMRRRAPATRGRRR
jgi:hypothetical protein